MHYRPQSRKSPAHPGVGNNQSRGINQSRGGPSMRTARGAWVGNNQSRGTPHPGVAHPGVDPSMRSTWRMGGKQPMPGNTHPGVARPCAALGAWVGNNQSRGTPIPGWPIHAQHLAHGWGTTNPGVAHPRAALGAWVGNNRIPLGRPSIAQHLAHGWGTTNPGEHPSLGGPSMRSTWRMGGDNLDRTAQTVTQGLHRPQQLGL